MSDVMEFEILEDGTISVKTSAVSEKNHASADEILDLLEDAMGTKRQTRHLEHTLKHHVHERRKLTA